MEIRQLQYFLAVAEELHFGRAALRLRMSQPPLSVQVRRLEEELGTPLFERSTRRVALTPAGMHLKSRVPQILEALSMVEAEMRDYAIGVAGQLSVGFVSSANYTVLPGVVALFRTQRPHVALSLAPLTSGEQLARLRAGSLNIGIVRDEPSDSTDPTLTSQIVFEERLVACLRSDHPLAGLEEVTAEQIAEVPMITYPRSLMPGFVDRVNQVLSSVSASIGVVEEVVHQETALGFIAAGAGTTILPASVQHLLPPSIVAVPLAGRPVSRLLAVTKERTPLTDAFIACLRTTAATINPR